TAKAKTTEPTKEQPSSKKEETAKVEQQEPKVEPAITEETNSIVKPPDTASTIVENIEVEKLTGPKILGKITLPVDSDTRPKPISKVEQHKRKRIVVDKKPGSNIQRVDFRKEGGGQTQTGNNNRGGNQQQQNRFGGKPGGGGGHPQRGGGRNAGNNRGKQDNRRVADKEIDAKEIQDKIKETQAKLAGSGGRGKSLKAKYRREKRQEAAEAAMEGSGLDDNKLQVTEFVTVSELANLMDVSFTDVISKCMGLGLMVSINQRLDAEVIELVAGEFGFEAEFTSIDDVEDEEEDDEDTPENLAPRSPIVTIMGHVDHGKTSLLDYIRNASVVAGEAGGITQHIGAYEVTLANGKNITFLDTPGHEAFTAMRARGAKVTDIAVIVVAADDAVMPQTKEAISHAQAANVPMIFAVNKIDKDGANPQKIYEQLSQMNLLVESWGGKYQSQELSAKKGLHINELLEKILLEAELLELKANANREATGTIIEASLDKGRGYVATILVQNGTLKQGDIIVSGQYYGRIKAMFNERNQRVQEAPPSTPVVILGLNGAPQAGEKFKVYSDEAYAKDIATKRAQIIREQGLRARKHITLDEIGRRLALGNFKELNIIIKGDVDGSVEALSDSLQKLSTSEVAVNVVLKAVGQISESDVLLATASDAVLIGFNVRPSSQASKLAATEGVQIKQYSIIYTAIEEIKSAMEGMLEPKVEEKEVATVEIREVFRFDKAIVAGCYVTEGKIKRDHKIKVFRDGILVYPRQEGAYAELGSLKRFKDDVKEVNNNYECGLTVKGFTDIQAGDTVVAYEEEEIKRTL
ncbi:MAG TPA: translation initiation factor IF-2, partial [Chitinophagaceae bacterium]|nr:translation initiation factor IF-2 [Chitinophagaceae bacterium]